MIRSKKGAPICANPFEEKEDESVNGVVPPFPPSELGLLGAESA